MHQTEFVVLRVGHHHHHTLVVVVPLVKGAGLAGFLAVLGFGILRPVRVGEIGEPVAPNASRVYWLSVAAEVAAIVIGARVIATVLDRPQLTVVWVVLVVGVHFLPFAKAFRAPIFRPLAWTLIGLSVAGAAAAVAVDMVAAPICAILAGVTLLAFSFADAGHH